MRALDRFLFLPVDLKVVGMFRLLFGCLLLTNLCVLGLDMDLWFYDTGFLSLAASRKVIDTDAWTIFSYLPNETWVVQAGFWLALLHGIAFTAGLYSRANAAFLFFWLISFQNRHVIIFDGEDQVFRLFTFFFVFVPCDRFFSITNKFQTRAAGPAPDRIDAAWALRLFQIQITLVYVGAAWSKLMGKWWLDGTALWYVTRLHDAFGKFPLPDVLFDHLWFLRVLTWSTLAFEVALPVLIWIPRTRRAALLAALVFHLALEYSMNLFLFHPLMSVGLLSFIACDPRWIRLLRRTPGALA